MPWRTTIAETHSSNLSLEDMAQKILQKLSRRLEQASLVNDNLRLLKPNIITLSKWTAKKRNFRAAGPRLDGFKKINRGLIDVNYINRDDFGLYFCAYDCFLVHLVKS